MGFLGSDNPDFSSFRIVKTLNNQLKKYKIA
jgi:hypothetical protein